ncbi:MAG: hypothetical protein WCJ01_00940 [Ignavibacteria bacterium]
MWIGLTKEQLWSFSNKLKIYLIEVEGYAEFPDQQQVKNAVVWVKLDERYDIEKKFTWPILLFHIKGILPISLEGKSSLDQLMSTFPVLEILMRRFDV